MDYTGIIIEESLGYKDILNELEVLKTDVEQVTNEHKTPWLERWTLHLIKVPEADIEPVVARLSDEFEREHPWYIDLKNDKTHYIIFLNKVFKVDLSNPDYSQAKAFGISIGIPSYQLDFDQLVREPFK